MNVNATLLIQIFNFFIAYLMFRYFLLKPAYRAIQQDIHKKESLEFLVEDDKRHIEQRRQQGLNEWRDARAYFYRHMPVPLKEPLSFKGVAPRFDVKQINFHDVEQVKKRLAASIINAVEGVGNE